MEFKILGARVAIHLRGERRKSDLKKLVREFRSALFECRRIAGEHITAEEFSLAVAAERQEALENMKTKKH